MALVVYDDAMSRIYVTSLLLLLLACRHPAGSPKAEWSRWFDGAFDYLPRWAEEPIVGLSEAPVDTPDGLLIRLGDGYHREHGGGCWDKWPKSGPKESWRNLCAQRVNPGLPGKPKFFLRPLPSENEWTDQYQSEEWQAGSMVVGGHRAIVERARATGGMGGALEERRISILLELSVGEWARLWGRTGDEQGYSEILRIAETIHSR